MKKFIVLEEEKKELEQIDGVVTVSASGVLAINKELGFSEIPIDTQRLGEKKAPNPYLIENNKGVLINAVARSVIVGYDKDGNPMLTTAVVNYKPKDYFLTEILDAIKLDKEAGSIVKEDALTEDMKLTNFIAHFMDDLYIVANIASSSIINAMRGYSEFLKFGERISQTFAFRNAMRKQPIVLDAINSIEIKGLPGERKGYITLDLPDNVNRKGMQEMIRAALQGGLEMEEEREEGTEEVPGAESEEGKESSEASEEAKEEEPECEEYNITTIPMNRVVSSTNESKRYIAEVMKVEKGKKLVFLYVQKNFPGLKSLSDLSENRLKMLAKAVWEKRELITK